MPKRVLNVGQCAPDHSSISDMLQRNFDVQIDRAHVLDDTLSALDENSYDLVLVNRLLDEDGSEGLDVIQAIQARAEADKTPVMMVTNYPQHQQTAVAAGAKPGFGKNELRDPAAVERLREFLS